MYRLAILLAVFALGCGPDKSSSTTADTTEPSTTEVESATDVSTMTGDWSSTGGETGTDTGDPTTVGETDTQGEPTAGETDTQGETTAGACPLDADVELGFTFSEAPDVGIDADYQWSCDVLWQETDEQSTMSVLMMCGDGDESTEVTLDLWAQPDLPVVSFPAQVNLRFVQHAPWWTAQWIRVETTSGELQLAAANGTSLVPDGLAPDDLYAPLTATIGTSACATFDDDFCGEAERLLVSISESQQTWEDVGPNSGTLPNFRVWVRDAKQFVDGPECTDTPNAWYRVMVLPLVP